MEGDREEGGERRRRRRRRRAALRGERGGIFGSGFCSCFRLDWSENGREAMDQVIFPMK